MINPLIPAEIVMTNLVGVFFWVGFEEVKKGRNFSIPAKTLKNILSRLKSITTYQFEVLKNTLTHENIKLFGKRFKQWLTGDFVKEQKVLNGEVFANVAMRIF